MSVANVIAACATSGIHKSDGPTYIPYEEWMRKNERPIVGMIRIEENRDLVIVQDFANDGIELRFRSSYEVNALIRKLEDLKENMKVLEGENE